MVEDGYGSHSFYDRYRTRHYTGVVSAFGAKYLLIAMDVDGGLLA